MQNYPAPSIENGHLSSEIASFVSMTNTVARWEDNIFVIVDFGEDFVENDYG